jgi:hypothetical protein
VLLRALVATAVAVGICVLLARWHPPLDSYRQWLRDYFLLLIGLILSFVWLSKLFKVIGLGEYSAGYAPLFIVIGLVTLLGALTRAPLYWRVLSKWGLWASMSDIWRQRLNVVLGLVIIVGGLAISRQERTAYRTCKNWYAAAQTTSDTAAVDNMVPDIQIRSPRGRFEKTERPPMTCWRLLH